MRFYRYMFSRALLESAIRQIDALQAKHPHIVWGLASEMGIEDDGQVSSNSSLFVAMNGTQPHNPNEIECETVTVEEQPH